MVSGERSLAAQQTAESARSEFTTGCNCAESLLRTVPVTLGLGEAVPVAAGYAWTGGIDESGCLCGALAAAVSLAGVVAEAEGGSESERRTRARRLADELRRSFEERYAGTCCRVVRNGVEFGTPECRAHCAGVTAFTADLAVDVLGRGRDARLRGANAAIRVSAAVAVGAVAGLELAWLLSMVGVNGWIGVALGVVAGVGWAAVVVGSPRSRRSLARPGRGVAAAVAVIALIVLLVGLLLVPDGAGGTTLAGTLGLPSAWGPVLQAVWVIVIATFAAPAVRDLVRRRGSL